MNIIMLGSSMKKNGVHVFHIQIHGSYLIAVGEEFYGYHGLSKRQMWVLDQIDPEIALETTMTKLRLLNFEKRNWK